MLHILIVDERCLIPGQYFTGIGVVQAKTGRKVTQREAREHTKKSPGEFARLTASAGASTNSNIGTGRRIKQGCDLLGSMLTIRVRRDHAGEPVAHCVPDTNLHRSPGTLSERRATLAHRPHGLEGQCRSYWLRQRPMTSA